MSARQTKDVRSYVELDGRELQKVRDMAPSYPERRLHRWITFFLPNFRLPSTCAYCGKPVKRKQLVTSPITFQRYYLQLCRRNRCSQRLRDWEGQADTRRRRAQYDWEREHPTAAPMVLVGEIPPQYPSLSRATLRAFLDSGADIATLANGSERSVAALNGSIRSLGFTGQVFAEIRSGEAVLRRPPGTNLPARKGS